MARPLAACGTKGETGVLVENHGESPLHFTATIAGVDGLEVEPKDSIISPHENAVVRVHAPAQTPGPDLPATLTIASNDPVAPTVDVAIVVRRTGPHLFFDKSVLDFGFMPLGFTTPAQTVTITNDGNTPATLAADSVEAFSLSFGKLSLAPGESTTASVAFNAPRVDVYASQLLIRSEGHCGDPPVLGLKGQGVDGVVGVTPGMLDFGTVGCGTSVQAPLKVVVFNASKQAFQVFSSIAGTLFSAPPNGQMVDGESTVDIEVTMPKVPQTAPLTKDYFASTLEITTTAPKDNKLHEVPIVATPGGGVIALNLPPKLDFGHRDVLASQASLLLSLQNFGNMAVTVAATTTVPFSAPSMLPLGPGSSGTLAVLHDSRFQDVGTDVTQPVTLSTTDPVCAPLPFLPSATVHTTENAIHAATPYLDYATPGHACAVGVSGHVYCWGDNAFGQLGNGTTVTSNTPVLVSNLTGAASVAIGGYTSCAATKSGTVWCWGNGSYGLLGNGIDGGTSTKPVQVSGINDAVSVAVEEVHACARRTGGGVACWGRSGYVGDGSNFDSSVTQVVSVSNLSDAIDLDAFYGQTCAVRKAGAGIVCWGKDSLTQFAGAGPTQSAIPVSIPGSSNALSVSNSGSGACFLIPGQIDCWGAMPNNGFSTTVKIDTLIYPQPQMARSRWGTRLYVSSGQVGGYGDNSNGLLGMGNGYIHSGTFIAMGVRLVLAIDQGSLWQWGRLLGSNSVSLPTKVAGFDP